MELETVDRDRQGRAQATIPVRAVVCALNVCGVSPAPVAVFLQDNNAENCRRGTLQPRSSTRGGGEGFGTNAGKGSV